MIEIIMIMGSFEYVQIKNRCFRYCHKNYYIYMYDTLVLVRQSLNLTKRSNLVIGFFTMDQDIHNMGKKIKKHENETVFRFI